MVGKLDWNVQVWLCRRFLKRMTINKIEVLAHVTGIPAEQILSMHPACHTEDSRLAA